jgi:hypothetical protein
MSGVLLYTSAGDSEGSLGGLVQNGRPAFFENLFERGIYSCGQCSSDPLCIDNDPELTKTLNGAACHVCSFVSETSCEMSNRLLDRQLVTPFNDAETSFFGTFEEKQ